MTIDQLLSFNQTTKSFPEKTFLDLFEEQVALHPDVIAVQYQDSKYSYRQLNAAANLVAGALAFRKTTPGTVIAVRMARSCEMMVAIVGILKASCTFLPIDVLYPEKRIAYMLQNSRATLMITDDDQTAIDYPATSLIFSSLLKEKHAYNKTSVNGNTLAYVIYTSASTGLPKGVMISQANLCNFIYAMREHINFAAGRKLLMMAPISFDLSISETLLPLASGTTVIIATQDEQRDPVAFNDCLIRNNISMLHCTPSRLNAFLKDKSQLDWIKVVEDLMIGGEEFTPQLFTEVKQLYAGRLFNLYGPTEATVWATCKDLTHSNVLTIGSPLNNYTIYILDQEGRPASVEEVGELCIGGKGVALGYINNPELTASKFVDDPITGKGMIYKTGDLAKWTAEGEVNFLGRSDFQIKIRGFRVELGEIHKAVSSFTELQQVEIVVKSNGNGDKFICCYYISEKDLDEPALRQHLGLSLPEYMVPTFYKRISVFPLTFNGKIDRSALPFEMDEPQVQVDESFGGQLREIWEDVLGRKLASPDEDFIEAGGHSLSAVILLARINDVYKVRIPLGQFFQAPTISGLAETIKGVPVA